MAYFVLMVMLERKRAHSAPLIVERLILGQTNSNTSRNYASTVNALTMCLKGRRITGRESSDELLRVVRDWRAKGISAQTIKGRLSILRKLYDQFKDAGLRPDNPIDTNWCRRVKVQGVVRCPDRQEVERLDRVMVTVPGFIGARDRAMIGLMRFAGLRIFEISNLDHEHLERQNNRYILTVHGKYSVTTRVELWPQCVDLLTRYLRLIPKSHRLGPLFVPESSPERRLCVRAIRRRHDQYTKLSGWRPGLGPHSWRHWLAVNLLECGIGLCDVSRVLRHQFLSTTFNYYQNIESHRSALFIKEAPSLLELKF